MFECNLSPRLARVWRGLAFEDRELILGLAPDEAAALTGFVNLLVGEFSSATVDHPVAPDRVELEILAQALSLLDHPATDSTSYRVAAATQAIDVAVGLIPDDPWFEWERHDLIAIMKSLSAKAGT